jgi:hypothetical protein
MFIGLNVARGVYRDVVVGVVLVHFRAVHMGSMAVAMIEHVKTGSILSSQLQRRSMR